MLPSIHQNQATRYHDEDRVYPVRGRGEEDEPTSNPMDSSLDSSDGIPSYFNIFRNGLLWDETIPVFSMVDYDIRKIKVGLSLDEDFLILREEV